MKLSEISFNEFKSSTREWDLESFILSDINLLVGKNSSGKSRTLNVIAGLSGIILGPEIMNENATINAIFSNNNDVIIYEIIIFKRRIVKESLTINDVVVLKRITGGNSFIYNEQAKMNLSFEMPANIASISRRDSIQYSYFEQLYNWALNVRHFQFSSDLGKNHFNATGNKFTLPTYDLRDTRRVIDLFLEGQHTYKTEFTDKIIADFNSIGYSITKIVAGQQINISFTDPNLTNPVFGLLVQEADRSGPTDQYAMSTGMFRALAIIIFMNYYELSNKPGTILIDDIGEGLDFERSQALINLLIDKAPATLVQLLMSTNDRFVMNNTPLAYWQIIERKGGKVSIYNHLNSPKNFQDFKFTGLNNFDFFTTGFFKDGFANAEDDE